MLGFKRNAASVSAAAGQPPATSFLPEDYLQRRWESRVNTLNLLLFGIVLFGVVGAFFVTHQAWNAVRAQQREINAQYTEETKRIEQLKVLETQKSEMLDKAEVTTTLIERVPRSILLAELINRMPERLTLTEVEVKSKRIVEAPPPPTVGPQSIAKAPGKPAAKPGAPGAPKAEPPRPKPPKMEFTITISGLSANDEAVADYLTSLKTCGLLERVDHLSSTASIIDNVSMRKFKLEAQIRADADARKIDPLKVPRLDKPLAAMNATPGEKRPAAPGTDALNPALGEGNLDPTKPVANAPERRDNP
jgi:Tfp pilus assembly protein PilN